MSLSVPDERLLAQPFWDRLAERGEQPAVVTPAGERVSYAGLADRVDTLVARLGSTRRLVLLAGANDVDALVGYLACLAGGHPAILVPGDHPGNLEAVLAAYDPDVVLAAGDLAERHPGTVHDLHPDLALLLSTSGSTGSPKLVRLSAENLTSNAVAIGGYLGIRTDDVAATTLPMHYCYGLSVLNSHLAAGATLLLSDLSVVDPCFWDAVRRQRVTTFAGVPYTFDLLDRAGFADLDLPDLRYLTQAGGRLAPERVREYAALGRRRGWDLFVMYGQTEATARMAYLPPDLAEVAPEAVGVPISGGAFHLEPLPEVPLESQAEGGLGPDVGELVYEGPNVMLGYATGPADLGLGREVHRLRTGDVARRRPDGLVEIIGRRNRFAKIFGLRVDLDQVESLFADGGHLVQCLGREDRLLLAVDVSATPADPAALAAIAKEHLGLPARAVEMLPLDGVPRLPSGKTDYRSIDELARHRAAPAAPATRAGGAGAPVGDPADVRDVRALLVDVLTDVLGREDVTDADSFVSLGGDSLSYVETSLRFEGVLGRLPAGWHLMPVNDLAGAAREADSDATSRAARGRSVETNVLLRAVAIVAIVATHANLFTLVGGAHVLLGVAGFNFGRFHLSTAERRERVRRLAVSTARIAVPSVLWLALVALLTRDIGWRTVLLLNGMLGPRHWTEPDWWWWFVEVLVWTLLALTAALAVPWVDRLERRRPFALPMTLALAGLLTRYDLVEVLPGDEIHRASVVFWLFALGWATVKATNVRHRLLVSAVVVASVPGFFADGPGFFADGAVRDAVVIVGLLLLVWVRSVRVPTWAARACGVLAASSLYVYLAHWQIYPALETDHPLAATLLSLAGGIALWQVASRLTPSVERAARRLSDRRAR